MNAALFASLEKAINEWVDRECEYTTWPDVYLGRDTVKLMARAAASVLDACAESQEYAVQQGALEYPGARAK